MSTTETKNTRQSKTVKKWVRGTTVVYGIIDLNSRTITGDTSIDLYGKHFTHSELTKIIPSGAVVLSSTDFAGWYEMPLDTFVQHATPLKNVAASETIIENEEA